MALPYWLPPTITALALLAASWALMALAWRDLTLRRLPNAWVGTYAALFLLYAWASGMGWSQLGWHVVAGLATAALMVVLFAMRIMGGGDVKLWGALLLWVGPQGAIAAVFIATVSGALLGVFGWMASQILKRSRKPKGAPLFRMLSASRGVPYGVGLALAGLQNLWVTLL